MRDSSSLIPPPHPRLPCHTGHPWWAMGHLSSPYAAALLLLLFTTGILAADESGRGQQRKAQVTNVNGGESMGRCPRFTYRTMCTYAKASAIRRRRGQWRCAIKFRASSSVV